VESAVNATVNVTVNVTVAQEAVWVAVVPSAEAVRTAAEYAEAGDIAPAAAAVAAAVAGPCVACAASVPPYDGNKKKQRRVHVSQVL